MTLSEKVREEAVSMSGEFTMPEFMAKLMFKNIMVEGNKGEVLDAIDECLENDIIRHVPYTDKYFVK